MLPCSCVDNCGLAASNRELIDDFVNSLKKLGFDLDVEDNFEECLGIGTEAFDGGTWHMTQKGLIEKAMSAVKLNDCNPNWTPSSQVALGKDKDGEPFDESFDYASVVGCHSTCLTT